MASESEDSPTFPNSSGGAGASPMRHYLVSATCRAPSPSTFLEAKPDNKCGYFVGGNCPMGSNYGYDDNAKVGMNKYYETKGSASIIEENLAPNACGDFKCESAKEKESEKKPRKAHKFSVNAPEFVPSWLQRVKREEQMPTYSAVVGSTSRTTNTDLIPLCPYFECGQCEKGDECELVHGIVCDLCNVACLHPGDENQRKQHRRECVAAHEAAMEEAFGEALSAGKICGICMENIRERNMRFGILEGCRHVFCLDCIRQWRKNQSEQFDKKTVRSCPECRTHSDFVIPAKYWVDDPEDKKKLIAKFHENTKQKPCKYFRGGNLEGCPFGNKCFYKHVMPDGSIAEGESPSILSRRRRRPRVFEYIRTDGPFSDSEDESVAHMMHQILANILRIT